MRMSYINLLNKSYDKTIFILNKIVDTNNENYILYSNFIDELKNYFMNNNIEKSIKESKNFTDINLIIIEKMNIDTKLIEKSDKNVLLIFYFFCIDLITKLSISKNIFNYDKKDLLKNYPHYEKLENDEIQSLIKFRNILKCALLIMTAKTNKQKLFIIIPLLVGEGKRYITGGGQKKDTERRVEIYNFEGNVIPCSRNRRVVAVFKKSKVYKCSKKNKVMNLMKFLVKNEYTENDNYLDNINLDLNIFNNTIDKLT
jgi:hypothetical protein